MYISCHVFFCLLNSRYLISPGFLWQCLKGMLEPEYKLHQLLFITYINKVVIARIMLGLRC
jgi:hypothetical protein